MFQELFRKIDAFNELKDCKGEYTLINKDGEITFSSPLKTVSMPTYKDKETYLVCLCKPDKDFCAFSATETVISAGYDENANNKRIQRLLEFMDSVEGPSLFKNI